MTPGLTHLALCLAIPGLPQGIDKAQLQRARKALETLGDQPSGAARRALRRLQKLIPRVPSDDQILLPRLRQLRQQHPILPTAKKPLRQPTALHQLLASLQLQAWARLPAEEVKAHPSAQAFPGKVPATAPRVAKNLLLTHHRDRWRSHGPYSQGRKPTWHSTGLYAPPGEVVTIEVPKAAAAEKLRLRIGCHADRLWRKKRWRRWPEISRAWPLEEGLTKVASPFGGLVYVEVAQSCRLEKIELRISGAVQAPWFVLGRTSPEAWRQQIRQYPAPWGEIGSDKLVIAVPSRVLRRLNDPTGVLELWDQVMDAQAELAGWPRQRYRPERFVPDIDISAGYMHAGYPLMTMMDIVETIVDRERVASNKHRGTWGFYHEIGHNHQGQPWTFRGTTEVTVNLFTLYTYHKVFKDFEPRKNLYGEARLKTIGNHMAKGADFDTWKSKPFLALIMYMQLQEAFGWESFRKVFAEYRELPASKLPKNDAEKRDQWLLRFSRCVGKNLGPFFERWGVPTSLAARESLQDLPTWMPKELLKIQ